MQNINPIKKILRKKGISLIETSRLIADFFNGMVVEVEEEYIHES